MDKQAPDGYLVKWTEGDSQCSRIFQFELDALRWAANTLNGSSMCKNISIIPLFAERETASQE